MPRPDKYAHKSIKRPEQVTPKALRGHDSAMLQRIASTIGRCPDSPQKQIAQDLIRDEYKRALIYEASHDRS